MFECISWMMHAQDFLLMEGATKKVWIPLSRSWFPDDTTC